MTTTADRPTDGYLHRGIKKGPMRDLAVAAVEAGWRGKITGHNSLMLMPPNGGTPVVIPLTTSDSRAHKNARALLRRAGLDV